MPKIQSKQKALAKSQLKHQIFGRLKVSNLMELPEEGFGRLIQDVEDDPLFKKLYSIRPY